MKTTAPHPQPYTPKGQVLPILENRNLKSWNSTTILACYVNLAWLNPTIIHCLQYSGLNCLRWTNKQAIFDGWDNSSYIVLLCGKIAIQSNINYIKLAEVAPLLLFYLVLFAEQLDKQRIKSH